MWPFSKKKHPRVWFDAEGDFQDTTNYVNLFAEILEAAGITGAEIEDGWANEQAETGFTITVRVAGETYRFVSEQDAEEWADVDFVIATANQLGKVLGFVAERIELGDQTVLLEIKRATSLPAVRARPASTPPKRSR